MQCLRACVYACMCVLACLLLYIESALCGVGATDKTITTRTVGVAAAGLSVPEATKGINCALNNNNIPFRSLTAH